MTTLLAAVPGYGLTREMRSRTDVLTTEVQTLLARRLGDDLTNALFKKGLFRTVPHFDALPAAVKRDAGGSVLRFPAHWDREQRCVWIDASLRHGPSFATDVIASAAWMREMPGDKLLDDHLDAALCRLYKRYVTDFAQDTRQTSIRDLLQRFRLVRGARTPDAPRYQRTPMWGLAVVVLEHLSKEKIQEVVSPETQRWFEHPGQKTLKALGFGLTTPAELCFLRLQAWAAQEDNRSVLIHEAGQPGNVYAARGLPLAVVTEAAELSFPAFQDWFGAKAQAPADSPDALSPFTGPDDAVAHYGTTDIVRFAPAADRPLGSFDVRPAAVLTATVSVRRDPDKKEQAVILHHRIESRGESESRPGPVFPFVETGRETTVVIRRCQTAETLDEAWLELTIPGKTPVNVTAYAAHWAHAAGVLRAETPLTTHLWCWATQVTREADPRPSHWRQATAKNALPTVSAAARVTSVKPLGDLLGRPYWIVEADWGVKALAQTVLVMPVESLPDLQTGDRILVRGLLAAGAFFPHTPEATAEVRRRQLPPTRRQLAAEGESVARHRRELITHPTAEGRITHAATRRTLSPRLARKRLSELVRCNTLATVFLALQQALRMPSERMTHLPEILFTAGQLLAAGYEPAYRWLLQSDVIDLIPELPGIVVNNLFFRLSLFADHAGTMRFLGDRLTEEPGKTPHDKTEGLHWLFASAARGHVPSFLRCARCLALGEGVAPSMDQCLAIVSSMLRVSGSPEIFYLYGALQLMGADFYRMNWEGRRAAVIEHVKTDGRPGDWVLLILHLLFEAYPESEGRKPLYAAWHVAQRLIERTGVTTATQLVKLAEGRLLESEREAAEAFDAWGWLQLKAPAAPTSFEELTNPLSETLARCLQSEAFFDDLAESLGAGNEASFLKFVTDHLVPMSPGLAADADNPSADGVEVAAYVGIADTGNFAGTTPALGCIRAADRLNEGRPFFFPFFPEGLAVRFRLEEAYATNDDAAAFLRIELQDKNDFPLKSLVAFDPLWTLIHSSYEINTLYRGSLTAIAEKVFTAPPEMKPATEGFMTAFEDTVTETPPGADRPGLYACGGRLETIEPDFTDIAGLAVARLLLTIRLGGRAVEHFPVYISKPRLEAAFPQGLPAAGDIVFAEINLHCLVKAVAEDFSHAGRTLQ